MLDDLVRDMRARAHDLRGLNARVLFRLGAPADTILVDARRWPVAVTVSDADTGEDVDCTLRMSPESLAKLMDGRLNPMLAYTMGTLKVEGSPGVAMKLAALLDG